MIHHGDLFDVLPTLAAESIDACVCDPPYGISFMGKSWDNFSPKATASRIVPNRAIESDNPNLKGRTRGPASSPSAVEYDRSLSGQEAFQAWTKKWAAEVLRVLKPGAYAVVCGAPRSHHRMMSGLEDAGFVIRDCMLFWGFGQGFPKSYNLGDGKGTALKPAYEPIALAWKPFNGTISACHEQHGTAALNIEKTFRRQAQVRGQCVTAKRGPRTMEMSGFNPDIGRWPANVILDESAAVLLDEQTGELLSGANPERRGSDKFRSIYSDFPGQADCVPARGADRGGASAARFGSVRALPRRTGDIRQARQGDKGGDEAGRGQREAWMSDSWLSVAAPGGEVTDERAPVDIDALEQLAKDAQREPCEADERILVSIMPWKLLALIQRVREAEQDRDTLRSSVAALRLHLEDHDNGTAIRRLQEALRQAEARGHYWEQEMKAANLRWQEAEVTSDALEQALREYGNHTHGCYGSADTEGCECGFDDALAAADARRG